MKPPVKESSSTTIPNNQYKCPLCDDLDPNCSRFQNLTLTSSSSSCSLLSLDSYPVQDYDKLCRVFTASVKGFSIGAGIKGGLAFFAIISRLRRPSENTTEVAKEVNVGVILNLKTLVGKVGLRCVKMAVSDFYSSHNFYKTRIVLHERDSGGKVLGAVTSAEDLVRNVHVNAIIGPQSSMQAHTLINLGEEVHTPIVSFSATSPSLSSLRSPNFIRAVLNDSYQVQVITALLKAYSWREIIPIYVDNEFGEGIIPSLSDEMQNNNIRIKYRSVINPSSTSFELEAELYKLMTMQTRVFIVHMEPDLGARLFAKAKEIGMISEGYVWIVTDAITSVLNWFDPSLIQSMRGVLGIQPYVPKTRKLEEFLVRWKTNNTIQQETGEPSIYGFWAYDATVALAIAIERVWSKNISNLTSNVTFGASEEFGQNLSKELWNIHFEGLSGNFRISRGQLVSATYEIINIVGNKMREIGFWSPQCGIVKDINNNNTNAHEEHCYSTSMDNLGAVTWPGGGTSIPKGWVIPTNGKKLRIGVPQTDALPEFVKLKIDPITNSSVVSGFSIDVFDAVMAALPYHVPYEYIPFVDSEGIMLGDYDELVYQVFLERYDAVVGDVTIRANRTSYVEFTLPYTESGVVLVVPYVEKNKLKAAWIFWKPLTWKLWVVSGGFFIWIGIVVCILEACSTSRNKKDGQGSEANKNSDAPEAIRNAAAPEAIRNAAAPEDIQNAAAPEANRNSYAAEANQNAAAPEANRNDEILVVDQNGEAPGANQNGAAPEANRKDEILVANQNGEAPGANQNDVANKESKRSRFFIGRHTLLSFYSTFTNLVDNKDQVVGELARFVVILWCLVVLILTQSYTASLASILTVSQLEPTVNDIHEIVRSGQNVACQKNSFVRSLLKEFNFTNSNIKTYESIQELHAMFKNGSIGAVFDEIPYMRIFLAKYCGKYTMVQPPLKTNGFGFVFPIGSPLVHDVSKAVLTATEEQHIKRIERAWLEQEGYCSDDLYSTTSASLGIESFWGLFVVTGVCSVLALIACLGAFVYGHRTTILGVIFYRNREKVVPGDDASVSVYSSARSSLAHEGTLVRRSATFPPGG